MTRDAQQTKQRLLEAAIHEFARYGIAGARVDRIADQAGCSKALIYDYFGNKDQLFDAAFDALVITFIREVPIDATDLAEYVGRLFDQYQRSPEILRLSAWDRLERGGAGARLAAVQAANQNKLTAIEQAQRDGHLTDRFQPTELLLLITALSTMWAYLTPDVTNLSIAEISARRRTVTDAVHVLIEAHASRES